MAKISLMSAIVFMAIGLVSGFISNMITGFLGWEQQLMVSGVTFLVFFLILVYIGKASFEWGYLLMFCFLGFVSSWISGFLGGMWGIQGSLYGSALTFIVFFLLLALMGPKKTGVQPSA